jgi:predicted nucleic acid-binding Zn ribbon protein
MTEGGDSVFRIRDLLGDAGRSLGLASAVETGMVWSRWVEIVGPAVAEHAEPSSLKAGVLRVRTDSPAWATEIGYLGDQIKASANQTVGVELVKEVRVWTGPGRPRQEKRPSPPKEADALKRSGARDADPQTAFERAREAWSRRRNREV